MVGLKGSQGVFEKDDVQSLAQGTSNFLREMKPHALAPTNAKELILKDADYSTPQDHYFNYTNQNKSMLDTLSMQELNNVKSKQEFNVIAELYEDQEGRAESIERHIEYLREKRRKKTMMELYNDLQPEEIENIKKNWPTTMENLKL